MVPASYSSFSFFFFNPFSSLPSNEPFIRSLHRPLLLYSQSDVPPRLHPLSMVRSDLKVTSRFPSSCSFVPSIGCWFLFDFFSVTHNWSDVFVRVCFLCRFWSNRDNACSFRFVVFLLHFLDEKEVESAAAFFQLWKERRIRWICTQGWWRLAQMFRKNPSALSCRYLFLLWLFFLNKQQITTIYYFGLWLF